MTTRNRILKINNKEVGNAKQFSKYLGKWKGKVLVTAKYLHGLMI